MICRRVPMCELAILVFCQELSMLRILTWHNRNAFYRKSSRIYRVQNSENRLLLRGLAHMGLRLMIKLVNLRFYLVLLLQGLLKLKKISFL